MMKLSTIFSVLIVILACVQTGKGRRRSYILPSKAERKAYPLLASIVKAGGHRGLEECQKQFKNEVWNCTMDNKNVLRELPIFFKTTLPYGKKKVLHSIMFDGRRRRIETPVIEFDPRTRVFNAETTGISDMPLRGSARDATRETALLHAISAAAITHEITQQCRENKIPGCQCVELKNRQPKGGNGDWQWGGCSDNIWFGENMTRSFIDSLEQENNARKVVNLHNNDVGRKVVKLSVKRECKCHGVTGSCNFKTCWKSLAPFSVVGAELKKKYSEAVRVTLVDNVLRGKEDNKPVARRDKKLVFLDSSPNYCVRNKTAGSLGLLGRTCRSDDVSTSECVSLCESCNLRHRTVEQSKGVKCKCKFVWCCSVECETCTKTYSLTTCTRR